MEESKPPLDQINTSALPEVALKTIFPPRHFGRGFVIQGKPLAIHFQRAPRVGRFENRRRFRFKIDKKERRISRSLVIHTRPYAVIKNF